MQNSLITALGITTDASLLILNEPENYFKLLGTLPAHTTMNHRGTLFDFVHFFATTTDELTKMFPFLIRSVKRTGIIWISWPTTNSQVTTDLTDILVQTIGKSYGMTTEIAYAIDANWSGRKFIYTSFTQ